MGIEVGPPTQRAMIKTGTYVGDGNVNHDIDIGVNLASKSNVYIIIKGDYASKTVHRIEYGQGDKTMWYDGAVDDIDIIRQFTTTGFRTGGHAAVNFNGTTYRYIAFWQEG